LSIDELNVRSLAGRIRDSGVFGTLAVKAIEFGGLFALVIVQNKILPVESLANLGLILSSYSLLGTFAYGPAGMYVNVNFAMLLGKSRLGTVVFLNQGFSLLCAGIIFAAMPAIFAYARLALPTGLVLASSVFILSKFLFMGQTNFGNLLFLQKPTAVAGVTVAIASVVSGCVCGGLLSGGLAGWLWGLAASNAAGYVLLLRQQIHSLHRTPSVATVGLGNARSQRFGALGLLAISALPIFRWTQFEFPRLAAPRLLGANQAGAYFASTQLLLTGFTFIETLLGLYYIPILNYIANVRASATRLWMFVLIVARAYGYVLLLLCLSLTSLWWVIRVAVNAFAPHIAQINASVVLQIILGEVFRQVSALFLLGFLYLRAGRFVFLLSVISMAVIPAITLYSGRMELPLFVFCTLAISTCHLLANMIFAVRAHGGAKRPVWAALFGPLLLVLMLGFQSHRIDAWFLQVIAAAVAGLGVALCRKSILRALHFFKLLLRAATSPKSAITRVKLNTAPV
jgi:hypothetical protein